MRIGERAVARASGDEGEGAVRRGNKSVDQIDVERSVQCDRATDLKLPWRFKE